MVDGFFNFQADDGSSIFVHQWLPEEDTPIVASVQIAHGMAEHGERYAEFAGFLNKKGFAVYVNDHRGHGKTGLATDSLGHVADENGWDLLVGDMYRLTREIKSRHEGVPLFLFGHSLGSLLARDYISRFSNDIDGVIISGTGCDTGVIGSIGIGIASVERRLRGPRPESPMMNFLIFGAHNRRVKPKRTDMDWLSRDEAQVDKYIEDASCGFLCSVQFYIDIMQGVKKIHLPGVVSGIRKDLPMYIFSGTMDPVGPYAKGVERVHKMYADAGIGDLSIKLYPDGRHEMLNELNKEEVYEDVLGWLQEHLERK